ncbi:Phage integrase family protein [Amphritea atlantica]|uniref:Phage integrase family protein n=1 Tax=Amphritea atlantica TaxID=355243 RepID=A0A1H9GD36_9GAMM|nr:tyrosine-type recombinase/integrase [Amphritea atlantica]SEQ47923.1 Phage integrase family protein [Amphritea atlantica]
MATITARTRKDGSVAFLVQIRIRRKGVIIYHESETFDQRKKAERWAKRREAFIDEVGVDSLSGDLTLGQACARYVDEVSVLPRGIGRSKLSALKYMQRQAPLADLPLIGHTSAQLMDWLRWRVAKGASPATAAQDAIYLKQVLEYARSAWGKGVDLLQLEDARRLGSKYGLIGRAEAVDRRPELDELSRLLAYFDREVSGPGAYARTNRTTPMVDLVMFQVFSARRVAETCRIEWADLDYDNQRVLVRDMKHPRKKQGNHKWVSLPARAWAVVMAQPRVDDRIFPYNPRSVSTFFQRACQHQDVGVKGLRLHDLRHEGTSHYFELGWDITRVAMVTGHGSWDNLKRYTHLVKSEPFDKYAGWEWLARFGVE